MFSSISASSGRSHQLPSIVITCLKRCMISLMPDGSGWRNVRCSEDTLCPSSRSVLDGFLDRAPRAAPADHQQVAFGIAEHRRRLQRLLQRRELEAPHAHAQLVDLRVVGDVTRAVVRKAGERVHAVGLARKKRATSPVVASQS